jgi:hypothetical protein
MARSLQGRTLQGLWSGASAGLVAWLLIEKTGWFNRLLFNTEGIAAGSHVYWLQAALGGLFGLTVAVGVCLGDWREPRSNEARARLLVLSGITGMFGGLIGMLAGFWVYNLIVPASAAVTPGPTTRQVLDGLLARSIGWAIVGMSIGAAQGIPRSSTRAAWLGAVGGFMGGLAGGGFFEALEVATANPTLSRLIGFVFIGAAIGFFLEFVPFAMKQAWIRIERGRGEGSEYLLDKRWTSIGRSETADVSLFGDPSVAPIHLLIESGPTISVLKPAHKTDPEKNIAAIIVDGHPVTGDTPLIGAETITVGGFELKFLVKASIAPRAKRGRARASAPPVPESSSVPKVPRTAYAAPEPKPLKPEEVGSVATSRRIADDGLTGTKLHCVHGPYFDQIFALATRERIVLGRSTECDIVFRNDRAVSRRHSAVCLKSGRHWIEDLSSANGTLLNEAQVLPDAPQMLKPGDRIRLGDTVLEYE